MPDPDWDIPISLIMAFFSSLFTAWGLRVVLSRAWRWSPLMLPVTWFAVDGCYAIYWYFKNPIALEMKRDTNFLASFSLYGMCGLAWLYQGTLRELWARVTTYREK